MEEKKRYTTMVFPQGFDGGTLSLNIVLIPRNQDPFVPHDTGLGAPYNSAVPFADLQPVFELKVVKGLSEWPIGSATGAGAPVPFAVNADPASNKKALLAAIGAQFGAKINSTASDKAPAAVSADTNLKRATVHKYLPESYRNSFNFTSPRLNHAKTDDSYHCAVRKETTVNPAWKNSEDLSWGQVFAHILRQPMLARACGMIYRTSVNITAENKDLFIKGCYIYADIVNEEYTEVQKQLLEKAEGPFIKRYAARIPKLKTGNENARPVFAPILFPVLHKKQLDVVDPEPPKAPWDQIFAELNEYNDGFAKIVHAAQPVSTDLLSEKQNGSHPVKDEGIRLAWDDEQILTWYVRQLEEYKENPADAGGSRIDAPLGVYGYRVDVKEDDDAAAWSSLNLVRSKQAYSIGGANLNNAANEEVELPFQVFPTQLDNDTNSPYWLPMYYTGWTGKSLVLKDTDAIAIHQNDKGLEKESDNITLKQVDTASLFDEVTPAAPLRYGKDYRFRVRMMDISGGGPSVKENVFNNTPSEYARRNFKRYIAPGACRIELPQRLKETKTEFFNEIANGDDISYDANPVINIQRPLLNYPAVVFTGKYQEAGQDPVQLLIQAVEQQKQAGSAEKPVQLHPAIADPDVSKVFIKVEVETLRMDNLASENGRENYIVLYTTERNFNNDFEQTLSLPVEFHDIQILDLTNISDPFDVPELTMAKIHAMTNIPLPTARKIRLTIRGVCRDQSVSNEAYYGFLNPANPDLDSRYGAISRFFFYKETAEQGELLLLKENVPELQCLYLQPDPEFIRKGKAGQFYFFNTETSNQPDIMQRLAQQLGVKVKGLSLVAEKGERVVFGCNNKIRHHLSPDCSSITFSTKADLCHHWIGCIVYRLNRDWAWDGLEDVAFTIGRDKWFKGDESAKEKLKNIGDIELKHSASFEALQPDIYGEIHRKYTTIIFIDAIEPKSSLPRQNSTQLRFPDEILVDYTITPHLKKGHGNNKAITPKRLALPTTVNPAQVPKIVSVGMAFSKYLKGEKYNYTEPRQRYLWLELEEPVQDPHDTLFCRVLHYAPDQLIGNNQQMKEILDVTLETPPLPVDPEYIRIITPEQTDDMAGLGAMQAMEKAGDDDIHYLLPLPPGLHAESPELFGFFNYEFRIGHGHWSNEADNKPNLWSTAQGRFGRPLTVTGMQHPSPTLICNVNRDDNYVYVNAPYAKAVWEGKNVTSDPPRTQLHAVLYAQVKQADGKGYRNILLDTRLMQLVKPPQIIPEKPTVYSFRDAVVASAVRNTEWWSVNKTDEVSRAEVIMSNLSLVNEVSKLKVDTGYQRKINKAMTDFKEGKTVKIDLAMAKEVIGAFNKLKTGVKAELAEPVKFTNASLKAGAILAIYKDLPKTASIRWSNKEIAVYLQELGLPDDASLSVATVEVFGNITNLIDHYMYLSDEALQKAVKSSSRIVNAMLEGRNKSRLALTNELGNYRILRTSPLTEVPFVCCAVCD